MNTLEGYLNVMFPMVVFTLLLGVFVWCFVRTRRRVLLVLMMWSVVEIVYFIGMFYFRYYIQLTDDIFAPDPYSDSLLGLFLDYRWIISRVMMWAGLIWLSLSYLETFRKHSQLKLDRNFC